jgi:coenzyme Q-binding protein COQ10
MFDLVADVERYPEFLPLCEGLRIRQRDAADGREILTADMTVGYKAIRETFTSRVTLLADERRINVAYVDGPFRFLDNRWMFHPRAEGGSEVEFYIAYEFKSKMFEMLVGGLFDAAFRRFAAAFEDRARLIYGRDTGIGEAVPSTP